MTSSNHDNHAQETCRLESGELGVSIEHAVANGQDHEKAVDAALAMQLISIRLPNSLIDDLKKIAADEGLGYQPMIRRILVRFAAAERYKRMTMEPLVSESYDANINMCIQDQPRKVAAR